MVDTPTLAKRSKIIDESNAIGAFLDWLSEKDIHLAVWSTKGDRAVFRSDLDHDDQRRQIPEGMKRYSDEYDAWLREIIGYEEVEREPRLVLAGQSFSALLHEYFEIDAAAEERELRALLEEQRKLNRA